MTALVAIATRAITAGLSFSGVIWKNPEEQAAVAVEGDGRQVARDARQGQRGHGTGARQAHAGEPVAHRPAHGTERPGQVDHVAGVVELQVVDGVVAPTLIGPRAPVAPSRPASLTRPVPPTEVNEPAISTSPVLRTTMSLTGWLGVPTAGHHRARGRPGASLESSTATRRSRRRSRPWPRRGKGEALNPR